MSCGSSPSTTAAASARSSSAKPTWTLGAPNTFSCRAGTPSPACARPAPNAPRPCGQRNAARAGTSTTNPSSSPARRTKCSACGSSGARPRRPHATEPTPTTATPTNSISSRASWTRKSPAAACAATYCLPGPSAASGPRGGGRMRPSFPAAKSPRGRSARPTRRRTARRSGRRCSSPSPAPATAGFTATTVHR